MATETSYLNPETPHLDYVATNGTPNKTLKNHMVGFLMAGAVCLVLSIFAVGDTIDVWDDPDMYRVARGRSARTVALMSFCAALYTVTSYKKEANDKKRQQVADDLAEKLYSVATGKNINLDWYSEETKIMAAEHFLGCMTGAERDELKKRFNIMLQKIEALQQQTKEQQKAAKKAQKKAKKKTEESQQPAEVTQQRTDATQQNTAEPQQQAKAPEQEFLEYLLGVVNKVMVREQGLGEAIAGIAAGKTAVWANATQRAYGA